MLHENTQIQSIGRYVITALLKDNTSLYNFTKLMRGKKGKPEEGMNNFGGGGLNTQSLVSPPLIGQS